MDPNARSPNDEFTRKCLRLRDRVLAALDPRSLRQFREEFDFFNNFTVLSGKLLKIEGFFVFFSFVHILVLIVLLSITTKRNIKG